jgi:hypothetical protein
MLLNRVAKGHVSSESELSFAAAVGSLCERECRKLLTVRTRRSEQQDVLSHYWRIRGVSRAEKRENRAYRDCSCKAKIHICTSTVSSMRLTSSFRQPSSSAWEAWSLLLLSRSFAM